MDPLSIVGWGWGSHYSVASYRCLIVLGFRDFGGPIKALSSDMFLEPLLNGICGLAEPIILQEGVILTLEMALLLVSLFISLQE